MSVSNLAICYQSAFKRFPYLEEQILARAQEGGEFLGLCQDYQSVVVTLASASDAECKVHEELAALKSDLELEILERLTRNADKSANFRDVNEQTRGDPIG